MHPIINMRSYFCEAKMNSDKVIEKMFVVYAFEKISYKIARAFPMVGARMCFCKVCNMTKICHTIS